MQNNIGDYIIHEESVYQTTPVPVVDGYDWSMFDHVKKTTLYKNSKFSTGANDGNRPFKNIVRPILNVAYRSEGFDVKDIDPYVNDEKDYYKSFLIKKYNEKWARKNDIDTFIDEMVESYVDYGGALIRNGKSARPEVISLQSIAFCDQTDMLAGPIGIKHYFSVDRLLDMVKQGWYADKIDEAIVMSEASKKVDQAQGQQAKTTGKMIEVYEVHGMLPTSWLEEGGGTENTAQYTKQAQYVTFYKDAKGEQHHITLWKGRESSQIFKTIIRDKIFGRALGFGGVEELFEDQVWTNYNIIQMKEMLDIASMMILQTASESFKTKNNISDLEKGEVVVHDENKPLTQVSITPQNLEQFEQAVKDWEQHARTTGSASDPQLGIPPDSGTPFKLQDLVVQQGQGIHEYRQGKVATFVGELYRDWFIPYFVSNMNKGQKWISDLSLDELQSVAENVATNYVNEKIKDDIVENGARYTPDQQKALIDQAKQQFLKGGKKRFLEIFKDEMADAPVDVDVNIVGKQKDLSKMTDKLVNIFRQIIANPQVLAIPGMARLFNEILEYSGLSPIDFTSVTAQQLASAAPNAPQSSPQPTPVATGVAA